MSAPRKRVWAREKIGAVTLVSAAPQIFDLMTDFEVAYDADPIGCTVARIRGEITIDSSTIAATDTQYAFGILVGPDSLEAVDADPDVQFHLDWMFYHRTVGLVGDAESIRINVDVRSKRKMEELNETLWFAAVGTGEDTVVHANFSTLLLLP